MQPKGEQMNSAATSAVQEVASGDTLLSNLTTYLERAQPLLSAGPAASDPVSTEPEWPPYGQDLRDVALRLRLILTSGTSVAIATVVGAGGTALRRPGTVVVVSESGETLGFNPAGPLDGAIRDLADQVLTAGQDRLERLDIDHEAASYIGLSGEVSLDIHATRVPGRRPGVRQRAALPRQRRRDRASRRHPRRIRPRRDRRGPRRRAAELAGTARAGHHRRPVHARLPPGGAQNLLPRRRNRRCRRPGLDAVPPRKMTLLDRETRALLVRAYRALGVLPLRHGRAYRANHQHALPAQRKTHYSSNRRGKTK